MEATIALLVPDFDVVGTASDGETLVSEALCLKPDVIVTDITMPIINGIYAIRQLRELGSSARSVFFDDSWGRRVCNRLQAEGALGYVLKTKMGTQLMPAIRAALAGEIFMPPAPSR